MISAQLARQKSEIGKINKEFKMLENRITKAASDSKIFIYHIGTLCPENVDKLIELDYKVEAQGRGFKISWE